MKKYEYGVYCPTIQFVLETNNKHSKEAKKLQSIENMLCKTFDNCYDCINYFNDDRNMITMSQCLKRLEGEK